MSRVAVVGGGAAGIGAAWTLQDAGRDVVLIDAAPRLGGNCLAFDVRGDDGREHSIDLGVSDFNRVTFRSFTRLVAELGLETQPIRADAGFFDVDGAHLCHVRDGEWNFAPRFPESDCFVRDVARFREAAVEVLDQPRFAGWTIDEYLDHLGVSEGFRSVYVHGRAMGCFPMPDRHPGSVAIRDVVRFWAIHGLVGTEPSDRRVLVGGMHRYVEAFERRFRERGGELVVGRRVMGVRRFLRHAELTIGGDRDERRTLRVDDVVLAGNAPDMAALLADGGADRPALAAVPHQRARVVVHRDASAVGDDERAIGAFNYVAPRGDAPRVRPTITFHPNRLARLDSDVPRVYLAMNPPREPRAEHVLAVRSFGHPVAGAEGRLAADRLRALQGRRRTWFAGAYLEPPFVHESALRSGIRAARALLARDTADASAAAVAI